MTNVIVRSWLRRARLVRGQRVDRIARAGRTVLAIGIAVMGLCAMVGCDALPSSGPSAREINQALADPVLAARVHSVDISLATVEALDFRPTDALPPPVFRATIEPRIGVGDVISITVFEAASGGLFSGPPTPTGASGKNITLPPMMIGSSGVIDVPYVGAVQAAGQTLPGLQQVLVDRLQGRAIQPQIVVSMLTNVANTATITGAVKSPGRYNLTSLGESAIDLIALAGGTTGTAADTVVQWQSASRIYTTNMELLLRQRRGAIQLRPGDHLHVLLEPRSYAVFGAALRNGEYKFESSEVNLAEAVARSGGLNDSRADSRHVYVFRHERAEFAAKLLPIHALSSSDIAKAGPSAPVPVIYRLNLKSPEGFLLSQRFAIRSKDVVYVPNADSVQWQKFLDLLRVLAQPVTTVPNL